MARERWFARQIELGLLPPDTELAPRNPGVEPWDSLPDNQQRLAARLQEAFAAFLEHTDAQIGRLVDDLERLGQLDNTLIVLLSDNGASQEGGEFGVMHEMKYFNMILETPDEAVQRIDDIGGPHSHANYPWGWAQAGNTPFKWYKQNTHEGGVHVPLIVRWPARIAGAGEVRDQFHHVNDIAPTIYEVLGITAPDVYRGYEQLPDLGHVDGATRSTRPEAPTTKGAQYYEMFGHRAIVSDGWKAVTRHVKGVPFDDDVWELYHLDRGPLGVPRPGRRPSREAGRTHRPVVGRGRGPGRPAARRPEHRAVLHPVPRPLAPPDRAATTSTSRPMAPMPSQVSPGLGRPGLRHGGHHRPAAGARAACCSPPAPRTPASASSSRTTGWCSTTTASTTTRSWCPTSRCPTGPRW